MRRMIAAAALTAGLAIGGIAVAGPASAAQMEPGTPGTPNCKGQTIAFVAQVGKAFGAPGLGNLAPAFGLSVKELHAFVEEFCAAGEG
jgi:hypothetical protein